MALHEIKTDTNFKDIEDILHKLSGDQSAELKIPSQISIKGAFGIEGLVCQLIATWIRTNTRNRVLHTDVVGSKAADYDDLCSTTYGTLALRFADEIRNKHGVLINANDALMTAFERVRLMNSGKFLGVYKDLYVPLFSIRKPGVNKEFNNRLYTRSKKLDRDYLYDLFYPTLREIIDSTKYSSESISLLPPISKIICELFENAHLHARDDEHGESIEENFRAVLINSVSIGSEKLISMQRSGGINGLASIYTDWNGWMIRNDSDIPVLDITVVDSGPGYARRWLSKSKEDLLVNKELESTIKCFKKSFTTSNNFASGSGLYHVLKDIRRLKGWFRLRTGRVSVSKAFFNGIGEENIDEEDFSAKNDFIEGVSFNIVLPLVQVGEKNV